VGGGERAQGGIEGYGEGDGVGECGVLDGKFLKT
jgi:hypothetical protein